MPVVLIELNPQKTRRAAAGPPAVRRDELSFLYPERGEAARSTAVTGNPNNRTPKHTHRCSVVPESIVQGLLSAHSVLLKEATSFLVEASTFAILLWDSQGP